MVIMGRSVKPRVFWLNQFLSKCFAGSRFPFQISNSEGENYKCVHLLGCICWDGNNWERSGKFWKINASCGGGGQELDQAGQPHLVPEVESLKTKKYCNQLSGWHAIASAGEQAWGATGFFHLPGPAENVLDSKAGKKRISLEFIAMEPQPQPN